MVDGAWRIEHRRGVPVARCVPLLEARGIAHGFSLRWAEGDRRFDLGGGSGDDADVDARRARFLGAAGVAAPRLDILRQRHGAEVVPVSAAAGLPPDADGWLWQESDGARAATVRTADCVGLVVADRDGRAALCLHAGWRGAAAAIAARGVEALAALGVGSGRLVAALGPAILACCYEVADEVADAVAAASGGEGPRQRTRPGHRTLDLHAALARQLAGAGLDPGAIHAAPWCTRCRSDLFFSFRRDGGSAGRQAAVVGPSADP